MKRSARQGFIALVSVLILTAFMLIVTVAIAVTSYITRSSASTSYYKEISQALAESCVQKALLKLAGNPSYAGGETITVATSSLAADTCTIVSVSASSSQDIILTSGSFNGATTNLRTTASSSTLAIVGWETLSHF